MDGPLPEKYLPFSFQHYIPFNYKYEVNEEKCNNGYKFSAKLSSKNGDSKVNIYGNMNGRKQLNGNYRSI